MKKIKILDIINIIFNNKLTFAQFLIYSKKDFPNGSFISQCYIYKYYSSSSRRHLNPPRCQLFKARETLPGLFQIFRFPSRFGKWPMLSGIFNHVPQSKYYLFILQIYQSSFNKI